MASPRIVAPKKLIEVALPLDAINLEAARSKRKAPAGYPTSLHCWWAQRPLAAARAVIFAQLVNDPSWKYSPDELKKPQIKSAITRKRNELFKLIGELIQWANVLNESVLKRARAEIVASWKETCEANRDHPSHATLFNPSRLPALSDPFSGGGSIPLEAQRLGLEAHAADLNPVAVMINKALIEIPPRFSGRPPVGPSIAKQTKAKGIEDWSNAKGLAEDVRRYGEWMRDEAEKRIGHLYPKAKITKDSVKRRPDLKPYEGRELSVIACIWARTVKSPNPAFSEIDVPLASTFILSTKEGREAWVEPVVKGRTYRFEVRSGEPSEKATRGTKSGGSHSSFLCLMSESSMSFEYLRSEASAGRMGARLMAIVAQGDRGRVYLSPTDDMEKTALSATPKWKPDVTISHWPGRTNVVEYGLTKFGDLFTARQLVALTTFSDLIGETAQRVKKDALKAWGSDTDSGTRLEEGGSGACAYAEAVSVYLAFALDRIVDYGSSIATWRSKDSAMRATMSRQAIPMTWDFAEGSPFASSSSGFIESVSVISRVLDFVPASVPGKAHQADAQSSPSEEGVFLSTDPPYYDNIGYSDLSDFFYVWLRRALRGVFPSVFGTIAVPKAQELVANPYRHGGKEAAETFFMAGMTSAMRRLIEQAEPTTPITIYYAFKQSETEKDGTGSAGWETFLEGVLRSGLAVTGTWPVRTEGDNRQIGNDANALASSIVLVCRPRGEAAASVARKEFLREIERALPPAIAEMTADPIASIAPVDLHQACIGPGMALFSRHAAVLEADGSPMSVHDAIIHINKAIDNYFGEVEGDLDADTRFCIAWFQLHGFDAGSFGDADNVARAKGTSVEGVKDAGVVEAGKNKVRLFKIKELPKGWDPRKDHRIPVWEACHHMCRALGESEGDAGALLAAMPDKQEAVRLLAYRLYTLCERKRWAEQARPYNELIVSWPAIVAASQAAVVKGTQMKLI